MLFKQEPGGTASHKRAEFKRKVLMTLSVKNACPCRAELTFKLDSIGSVTGKEPGFPRTAPERHVRECMLALFYILIYSVGKKSNID